MLSDFKLSKLTINYPLNSKTYLRKCVFLVEILIEWLRVRFKVL